MSISRAKSLTSAEHEKAAKAQLIPNKRKEATLW